jgi:hypothetical protein
MGSLFTPDYSMILFIIHAMLNRLLWVRLVRVRLRVRVRTRG